MRCRRRASAHPVGRLRPRGSATSARPSRTLYGDEALACGAQRRLLLREAEAHERRTRRRVGIEDGDRDHGHAVLDREPASEVGIGLARDSPVVGELEIRALRRRECETRRTQPLDEEIALLAIEVRELEMMLGTL